VFNRKKKKEWKLDLRAINVYLSAELKRRPIIMKM